MLGGCHPASPAPQVGGEQLPSAQPRPLLLSGQLQLWGSLIVRGRLGTQCLSRYVHSTPATLTYMQSMVCLLPAPELSRVSFRPSCPSSLPGQGRWLTSGPYNVEVTWIEPRS